MKSWNEPILTTRKEVFVCIICLSVVGLIMGIGIGYTSRGDANLAVAYNTMRGTLP